MALHILHSNVIYRRIKVLLNYLWENSIKTICGITERDAMIVVAFFKTMAYSPDVIGLFLTLLS